MNVAIMGYGVVGSGTAEVLQTNASTISKRLGLTLDIKYILDLRDFPGDKNEDKLTKNFDDILNDESVSIVAEVMGGCNPAFEFTKKLLCAGKSVVTSNKELVATHGAELLKTARENGVNYMFEASVGGGVPIIRPIYQCLCANEIEQFAGIINGTTNFILTKMYKEDMSLEDALKLAQKLGYAEKDPTADICGYDVQRKTCILASLCFGKHIYPDSVPTEGIQNLSLRDVKYAKANGCDIKLLGQAKRFGDKICAFVAPAFVKKDSQLTNVEDVFNGIILRGNMVGEVFFYGAGAGKLPTASAVAADIMDCARHTEKRKDFGWEDSDGSTVVSPKEMPVSYYVRGVGSVAEVKKALSQVNFISLPGAPKNEIAFTTQKQTEKKLDEILDSIKDFKLETKVRVFE